jgi:hypothetical protein
MSGDPRTATGLPLVTRSSTTHEAPLASSRGRVPSSHGPAELVLGAQLGAWQYICWPSLTISKVSLAIKNPKSRSYNFASGILDYFQITLTVFILSFSLIQLHWDPVVPILVPLILSYTLIKQNLTGYLSQHASYPTRQCTMSYN